MLHWLRARNVALLRDVSLDFGESLNVVTGETGAGRASCWKRWDLVLGGAGPGPARRIRRGARRGRGRVFPGASRGAGGGPAGASARRNGRGAGRRRNQADSEIVIRRELRLGARGGSLTNRTTINGAAAPVAALRSLGVLLAEIYKPGGASGPPAARRGAGRGGRRGGSSGARPWKRGPPGGEASGSGGAARPVRGESSAHRRRARRDGARSGRNRARRPAAGRKGNPPCPSRRALGEAERLLRLLETAYPGALRIGGRGGQPIGPGLPRPSTRAAEADPQTGAPARGARRSARRG